jgi:molybdopterin-guanine dinucleotide biosynthesis protein A
MPGLVTPSAPEITGLVLAGGRGARMGGADKGLQLFRGKALVDHAIERLAPQVGDLLISANRNLDVYAARAARVLVDADVEFAGPLAGILAGLRAARSPWLMVVPCDTPRLPPDLVARLAQALPPTPEGRGAVVMRDHPAQGFRLEPVCCLLRTDLADELERYLASGQRKVGQWVSMHATPVVFDRAEDAEAFTNVNTPAELDG